MRTHLSGLFGLFGLMQAFASFTPSTSATRARPAQPPAHQRHTRWTSARGTPLTLRPVRTDDAALLGEFFEQQLSRATRYSRFHGAVGRLSAARLAWMAGADFKHHVAFIVTRWEDGLEHAVAEGRWVRTAVNPGAEFAMSVADAWQGCGIGQRLLTALVQTGREQGLPCLMGDVLPGNKAMQSLARSQGFECGAHPDEPELMRAELRLTSPTRRPAHTFGALSAFGAFSTAAWQL
jgi:GNAT superfamily N-acetyltransferase